MIKKTLTVICTLALALVSFTALPAAPLAGTPKPVFELYCGFNGVHVSSSCGSGTDPVTSGEAYQYGEIGDEVNWGAYAWAWAYCPFSDIEVFWEGDAITIEPIVFITISADYPGTPWIWGEVVASYAYYWDSNWVHNTEYPAEHPWCDANGGDAASGTP